MKNKPNPILIGLGLIALVTFIWWITNLPDNNDTHSNDETVKENLTVTEPKDPLESDEENVSPTPTFVDTTEKQREFSKKVDALVKATETCQKDVESLFPVDSLEGPSKIYNNFPKLKDAIQKFYTVVANRVEKSHELMNFLETVPDGEIAPDRLFAQLSAVEDCGEFEEEAILDQAMTTAVDYRWSTEQKKELTNLILNLFEQQLKGNLGLHQISSKIEVLHSLIDEGFLPAKFNQELTALDQVLEGAETDFRQSLPLDFSSKKLPTQRDVIDIKNAERESSEIVKAAVLEKINSINNQIN